MWACHLSTGSWLATMVERSAVAILEDLEQVLALLVLERGEAAVVDDEHVDARQACEQPGVGAVGVRQRELVEQPRGAAVEGAVAWRQAWCAKAQAT